MGQSIQKVECKFENSSFSDKSSDKFYTCDIFNQKIQDNDKINYTGAHKFLSDDQSVIHVRFKDCEISKIPQGLTNTFPNLKILTIKNSKLKNLNRNDLAEYKNLKNLIFDGNLLEFLPGDLFENFKNLEWISFEDNKLEIIEPIILDGFAKLKYVNFFNNPNYDKIFSTVPKCKSTNSFQDVKNQLSEKFFSSVSVIYYEEVKKLRESELYLRTEVQELELYKKTASKDVLNMKTIERNLTQDIKKLKTVEETLKLDNQKLKDSEKTLIENYKTLSNSEQQLKQEVERLKISERNLNEENQKLKTSVKDLNQEVVKLKEFKQKLCQEVQKLEDSKKKLNEAITKLRNADQIMIAQENVMPNHHNNSIFNDLNSYIQDESLKDFKIEIDSQEFYVHKLLLAIRSPTLAEMLRQNPEAENLKLVDIPVEIFESILDFLYTDEFPLKEGMNYMHVFSAANRLGIKKLENFAASIIMVQINEDNVVEILEFSNKYGHDELRIRAFEKVKEKYPKIEFKDEWAMDTGKIMKLIEYFKKMDAIKREISTMID